MIRFNIPPSAGTELEYIAKTVQNGRLAGDNEFTHKCHDWFEKQLGCAKVLLTPSCTHALEMAAILLNIQPGDEVIMPSYTFVSTANAFAMRGATIVFVDICPQNMNIDATLIEAAITNRTRAIVPVHYAGVSCDMIEIMQLAEKHGLFVVEDAAQAMLSSYHSRPVGTFGHLATYSFHETKNYTSGGEGGLLIINDKSLVERAEIIREKGTNRSNFFRGMVDKYSWVDIGSSYLLSEIQAAFLYAQLNIAEKILQDRISSWQYYSKKLTHLEQADKLQLMHVAKSRQHNGHMFYIKAKCILQRTELIEHLRKNNITAPFHYLPLHSSVAGKQFSRFHGRDTYTTSESERLLRLPLYFRLNRSDQDAIIKSVTDFFYKRTE
jgi:dTDP-4-amino-4,6-dideoxygalactose transaminase